MKRIFTFILFIGCLTIYSQVPYNTSPSWISTDITARSTGGMFADINQDGWLDYVVANGNDMARQRVAIYFNNGNGTLPTNPNWQSLDIDYHGHLDVGDVNGDGFPDVAVSVYLGANGFNSRGKVKLYLNNNGTLSQTPNWTSADSFYTFSCAFGDANGDGRLDLAVACGETYYNRPEQQRIYLNTGGILESLPSWKSSSSIYAYDVNWFDMDNDGDLDLVFANEKFPNYVYRNNNGIISTNPVWQSNDPSIYANSLFLGDVNKDGFIDLAISDNNQLGGTGKFKVYLNNNGMLNSLPSWNSDFSGYGSGILLADIDNDGDLDLITGAWWSPIRIYLNNNGSFNNTPQFISNTNSVVEAIFCGDINKIGMQNITKSFVGNGTRKLFYLSDMHLQYINRVIVGNDTLPKNQYCFDLENGWISFTNAPAAGIQILVDFAKSIKLDLGVTNWDSNIGNYLFTSLNIPVELISFSANVIDNKIFLNWTTACELNNMGFEVERKILDRKNSFSNHNFDRIGFVQGKGTTTEKQTYSFIDNLLLSYNRDLTLIYRLKQIDFDGKFKYLDLIEVEYGVNLSDFQLNPNYPNPFNSSTIISWQTSMDNNQTLKVYDVLGNEVATLIDQYKPAGKYQVEFDASNLSSGVYFYQLRFGNYIQTKKMILSR